MELNQFPFCPHGFSNFLCHVGFTRSRGTGKNKIMISDQQLFDFVKFHIVQDFLTPFYTYFFCELIELHPMLFIILFYNIRNFLTSVLCNYLWWIFYPSFILYSFSFDRTTLMGVEPNM